MHLLKKIYSSDTCVKYEELIFVSNFPGADYAYAGFAETVSSYTLFCNTSNIFKFSENFSIRNAHGN